MKPSGADAPEPDPKTTGAIRDRERMRVSVYVDEPFVESRGKRWAHLTADSAEELHAFAERLGLLRQSFQTTPGKPWKDHYDVTESTRELAIRMGAIAESSGGGVERRRKVRHQARESSDAR